MASDTDNKSRSSKAGLNPEQALEFFCEEVKLAVEFVMEETGLPLPKKAVLMASLQESHSVRAALESKLQLPTEFVNPSHNLNLLDEDVAHGSSLSALLGFSRSKIPFLFDMMPEDLKLSISLEKRGRQMMTTAVLALGLLAVISSLIAGYFYKQKAYLETLDKEIAKTQEYTASIEEKVARIRLMEKVKNPQTSFLNYLQKVVTVLAPGIYFSSIDFAVEDQVTLKGYAGQMSEVFDFAKALEELKVFKGVKSEHVSKKKAGDQILAEFEIHCLLE